MDYLELPSNEKMAYDSISISYVKYEPNHPFGYVGNEVYEDSGISISQVDPNDSLCES